MTLRDWFHRLRWKASTTPQRTKARREADNHYLAVAEMQRVLRELLDDEVRIMRQRHHRKNAT